MKLKIRRKSLLFRVFALALWSLAILWGSLTPEPYEPSLEMLQWDKLQHFLAYAMEAFLAGRLFSLRGGKPFNGWIWGGVFAIGFGVLMEIGQAVLTEERMAGSGDVVANSLGALAVLVAARVWPWLAQERKP